MTQKNASPHTSRCPLFSSLMVSLTLLSALFACTSDPLTVALSSASPDSAPPSEAQARSAPPSEAQARSAPPSEAQARSAPPSEAQARSAPPSEAQRQLNSASSQTAPVLTALLELWITHCPEEGFEPITGEGEGLTLMINGETKKRGAYQGSLTAPLHSRAFQLELLAYTLKRPLSELKERPPLTALGTLSLEPLTSLFKLNPFDPQSSPSTAGRFMHLSQGLGQWLTAQPINPNSLLLGQPLKLIYERLYQRSVRRLAEAYAYLIDRDRLSFERASYERAFEEMFFKGGPYLALRFDGLHNDQGEPLSPEAIGFWLRRDIDKSRPLLWAALKRVLEALDPTFLAQLKRRRFAEQPPQKLDAPLTAQERATLIKALINALPSARPFGLDELREALLSAFATLHERPYQAGELSLLSLSSGYPLEKPMSEAEREVHSKRPLMSYNPMLLRWCVDQLLPSAELSVDGRPLSELYNTHFKGLFRRLEASYRYLHEQRDLKAERFEYMMARLEASFDELSYLKRRFQGVSFSAEHEALSPHDAEALSFWLQRELDGTAPLLWGGLKLTLRRFDLERSQLLREPL